MNKERFDYIDGLIDDFNRLHNGVIAELEIKRREAVCEGLPFAITPVGPVYAGDYVRFETTPDQTWLATINVIKEDGSCEVVYGCYMDLALLDPTHVTKIIMPNERPDLYKPVVY